MQYQIREGAAVVVETRPGHHTTSFVWRPGYYQQFRLDRRNLEEVAGGVHYFRVNSAMIMVSSVDIYPSL